MKSNWLCLTALATGMLAAAFGCESSTDDLPEASAGAGGGNSSVGGGGAATSGGKGGSSGSLGSSGSSTAGASTVAGAAMGGDRAIGGDGSGGMPAGDCGDTARDGVVVYEDITSDAVWSCPVYTLTRPIFVRSASSERTVLRIDAGVTVRGVQGNLDAAKLPGALIVTRTARLDAVGTREKPIVFTSTKPPAERAPGDWGGVVMLGRGPTNVRANYETSGNVAGQMFVEGLPKTELTTYGAPADDGSAGGAGGGSGVGGQGTAGDLSTGATGPDPEWNCGTLKYARIEFAGFEVSSGKELNGLTLGACGRETHIDYVQIHESSDDGVELFGGTVNLSHLVLTGEKDDGLDWDQGWSGRAQFIAIQMHDDSALGAAQRGDSCVEADGWATPDAPLGTPSSPRIFNLTMVASKTANRGIRLRDGTQAYLGNSIVVGHPEGTKLGLIELGDVRTADWVTAGKVKVQNTILSGNWPATGEKDSSGTLYTEADYFTTGPGAVGNSEVGAPTDVLRNAFNETKPGWVPDANSVATENTTTPDDPGGSATFFDTTAKYRGAFKPGGDDWTAGWTEYP